MSAIVKSFEVWLLDEFKLTLERFERLDFGSQYWIQCEYQKYHDLYIER